MSAAGPRVAFSVGRSIELLDLRRSELTRVATSSVRPAGVAIEGRRLIWADGSRVLLLVLPR